MAPLSFWAFFQQAQLQAFSVKVDSALAQMQKEEEALAEQQRLQKQAKAAEIVEMMKENGFSIDDLNQALKPEHWEKECCWALRMAETN